MPGKYELKEPSNGEFLFNLRAGNGEIILTSERYTTKQAALSGMESVRKNSDTNSQYDRRTAKDDSRYFVLKAKNGEIIGRSEMYTTGAAMENGIESCMNNGPAGQVNVAEAAA